VKKNEIKFPGNKFQTCERENDANNKSHFQFVWLEILRDSEGCPGKTQKQRLAFSLLV